MIVPFNHVLMLAGAVLFLGLICVLTRRNLIMTLIGIEIMMNAAAIAFVGAALHWQRIDGQAFVLFILGVAATEVAVGLALVVAAHRITGSVDPDRYDFLRW
ncbi:MAG: NADH-quinone oxidoreductase subunit NuoK [Deltaproteobacteria bacterium]|nr:NADH-quinone oxidoreductase subunit NuoK [Deltaproteobacteria bacterium]